MPKNGLNVSLNPYDDIFSTEESRQEEKREQVQQIPIAELFPFKNHPFKVLDDESMQRTVESVEQYGVLSPLIARPRPEGGYEIISGHRRQHAAQLAGLETLPVIVREMDDDAAILLMVDSNLQRESIQKLKPIIRSTAAYAPPETVDGKPPVYPYTPIKSDFEDAGTVEEMMLYTELQSAVHAMIQRLEYSFTFNPSLLTSPKRKKQVAEILTEAEKYIWRIKEEIRCA